MRCNCIYLNYKDLFFLDSYALTYGNQVIDFLIFQIYLNGLSKLFSSQESLIDLNGETAILIFLELVKAIIDESRAHFIHQLFCFYLYQFIFCLNSGLILTSMWPVSFYCCWHQPQYSLNLELAFSNQMIFPSF